jgi:hypothetical protein
MRHALLCATVISPHLKRGVMADPRHYMLRPPPERELLSEEMEVLLEVIFRVRDTEKD